MRTTGAGSSAKAAETGSVSQIHQLSLLWTPHGSPFHCAYNNADRNTFTAFSSPDGVNWTQMGTSTTVTMAQTVYIGLAVSGFGVDCRAVDRTAEHSEFGHRRRGDDSGNAQLRSNRRLCVLRRGNRLSVLPRPSNDRCNCEHGARLVCWHRISGMAGSCAGREHTPVGNALPWKRRFRAKIYTPGCFPAADSLDFASR
jgi:hypothetical protein